MVMVTGYGIPKGQLISKEVLMSSIFSEKQTKEFDFTTMIPQIDLFLFVFLEEIEDTKKPFRNYLTFTSILCTSREKCSNPFCGEKNES